MDPGKKASFELIDDKKSEALKPVVFLIDDEEDLLLLIASKLRSLKFEVKTFLSAFEFQSFFAEFLQTAKGMCRGSKHSGEACQVFIITDFHLNGISGPDILSALAREPMIIGAVLQTGFLTEDQSSLNLDFPLRVFEKPVDFDELLKFIDDCNSRLARCS